MNYKKRLKICWMTRTSTLKVSYSLNFEQIMNFNAYLILEFYVDFEERIDILLSRNNQLADLLRKAKITIPQCKYGTEKFVNESKLDSTESGAQRPKALTNKISEDEAKKLQELETLKVKTKKNSSSKKKKDLVSDDEPKKKPDEPSEPTVLKTGLKEENAIESSKDSNEVVTNETVIVKPDKLTNISFPSTTPVQTNSLVSQSIGKIDNTCLVVSHNQIVGTLQKTVLSSNGENYILAIDELNQ